MHGSKYHYLHRSLHPGMSSVGQLQDTNNHFVQVELCNGPTHGNCVCGECLCNGNKYEDSGIWFEGDYCQISSDTNTQVGAVSTCDKLAPCVKTDLFPDNQEADKWEEECSVFPVRPLYECHNVNEEVKTNYRNNYFL